MIKQSLTILMLLVVIQLKSTEIKGGIQGFDGETIKATVYEDFFTFKQTTLSQSIIENGKFELSFHPQQTCQILLQIGTKSTSLFVNPEGSYNIGLEFNEVKNEGRAFNQLLDLYFIVPEVTPLNSAIKAFNDDFKKFMTANRQLFVIQRADKKVDDFVLKQENRIQNETSVFLKNYYKYALANLRDISGYSEDKIYSKYIENQEILYSHKEYMNFWVQYFKNDFDELTLSKKGLNIMKALGFENNIDLAIQEIKSTKGFNSEQVAELYLLQGLFEVYHIERLKPELIISLLTDISRSSSYEQHRVIAKNMIANLNHNSPNRQLEAFDVINKNGEKLSFNQFFNQTIYLNFWSAKSIPSLREMSIVKKLNEKYGEKIHFISISIDGQNAFNEACEQFQFDWNVFHLANKAELIDNFDLRTLPAYFLIDEGGKILQAHTKGPAEIEEQLYRMTRDL